MWPALVVLGGLDHGLCVGGRCIQQSTSRKGTVLGVAKQGATTIRVQWDDSDGSIRYETFFIHTSKSLSVGQTHQIFVYVWTPLIYIFNLI